ncbi:MAG: THUMP domain-containing protein [Bacteroidaceae bacterium]|nr:THUMP domain-containing protein [Bacteroidaceae bacterium]
MTEFEMIAKTFQGLEEILAKELIELGANGVAIGNRMVSFKGDKALMYKANFSLRTAIRILKPFLHFHADSADEVYEICKTKVEWEKYMSLSDSFAVDAVVNSEDFKHSKFVAYRVKDAIADWFREKYGKRPNVSVANPDLTFHIHISHDDCSLSLDSSGESLHKRGYRQEAMEAPLNEVLAAGMILMSGWDGKSDFTDPMCGSGTIPIEAALIARNMAPGLFRSQFAFEKWKDFDRDLFESIYNDDSQERPFEFHIRAYDKDPKAIAVAKRNAKAAGLQDMIEFDVRDFKDFEPIKERTVMITNPPYGERLTDDNLLGLYEMIGERLKHALMGGEAWIISYHYECFDKIGLKPSAKIPLFNGALPCELRKYEIFEGKFGEFRGGGRRLKKDDLPTRRSTTLRHKARLEEKKQESETVEEKKPFRKDGERKPFRKDSEKKPFRTEGERKPFKKDGEKKPYRKDGDRKPFRKDGQKPAQKRTYSKTKPTNRNKN